MAEIVLEVECLSKRFGALVATDNLSLNLRQGEIHALIGPNGAGKSTLIEQIAGNLKPDSGCIRIHDQDISDLSTAKRAQAGLGRCFQVSSLAMPLSVKRNVMIASQGVAGSSFRFWRRVENENAIVENALYAIRQVGLDDKTDTPVAQLSHGERRQVEVACALALKPKTLLLDEPMAGMGTSGSQKLTQFLASLKNHVPILLIEHDMDAVFQLADRISVLVYGKIIASGDGETIRNDAAVREAYLGDAD
ncbi:MAG: ABC transporter ATP-binding protein [Pseudomonadota bacterium]